MNNGSTKWTLSLPVSMSTVQHTIVFKEIRLHNADFQADFQVQERDADSTGRKIFYKKFL